MKHRRPKPGASEATVFRAFVHIGADAVRERVLEHRITTTDRQQPESLKRILGLPKCHNGTRPDCGDHDQEPVSTNSWRTPVRVTDPIRRRASVTPLDVWCAKVVEELPMGELKMAVLKLGGGTGMILNFLVMLTWRKTQ